MKLVISLLALLSLEGISAQGKAIQEARADLALAVDRLKETREQIFAEETPLIREVEELDIRVSQAAQDLKALNLKEANLAGSQRALTNELASRKGEFDFTFQTLNSYSKGFQNRLHVAELQRYRDKIDAIDAAAGMEDLTQAQKVEERMRYLVLGFERIMRVAGGDRFPAKAKIKDGSEILTGQAVVMGSQGWFANDGVAGFLGLGVDSLGNPELLPADTDQVEGIQQLAAEGQAIVAVDASGGRALKIKEAAKTLRDYLDGGGPVGLAIVGLGLLSLGIAVLKFIEISRFEIPRRKEVNLILDDLLEHRLEEAKLRAGKIAGLSGELAEAGVESFFQKRRILEDALLEKLGAIQPKLDRGLPFLALAAAAAPMMGLLGTVLGIMQTFDMMAVFGTGNAQNFSAGIGAALITTAMGLVVAIPVIIIHGLLKSLAKGRFGKAEAVALAFLNGSTEIISKPEESADPDDDENIEELEIQPA